MRQEEAQAARKAEAGCRGLKGESPIETSVENGGWCGHLSAIQARAASASISYLSVRSEAEVLSLARFIREHVFIR